MSARRYRSTIACHSCRSRKVRCSINVTGVPCIRCAQDHADCVVDDTSSIPRTSRHNGLMRQSLRAVTSSPPSRADANTGGIVPRPDATANSTPTFQRHSAGPSAIDGYAERYNIQDEERNGLEIAAAALGNPGRVGQVPFYTGDKTGLTSTLSLSSGESLARHLLIPTRVTESLCEEDRNYLKSKGVFNLPSSEACECLLQAYFRHVHPIVPIIEADQILYFFHAGRLHEYNLLLVWSVFFVAVNFVPSGICEREGYGSRKAMKAAMYSHAKASYCLYNNSGERDKTVLLQASLMLGFWHSEVDEHAQPWYWTGVSISLCQILGLHRNPDAARYNAAITDKQRYLWRRLWWTCFLRDRWLSLTLGRPLRIDLDDCDVAMPSVVDIYHDFKDIPESLYSAFIPDDLPVLAEYWIIQCDQSPRVNRSRPSRQRSCAISLQKSAPTGMALPGFTCTTFNYIMSMSTNYLTDPYRAILIVLYRPCLTDPPDDISPGHQMQWQETIRTKADAAASRTNDVLETLAQESLLEYALPMTPPLLIPAMQIHLLNCRSGNPLSRRLRLNKLNACMMVMEEFQKVYTVASIYRGIFAMAIQQICPEAAGEITGAATAPVSASAPGVAVPQDQSTDITTHPVLNNIDLDPNVDMNSMVDALLDESSTLNFWETWNQMWVE
ncbi:hypothetical protein ASPVEDRAFT_143719 [Aspergillus versicolor CBS 583.65]|uniref:Zn(2)-C6 fungal-type domain-containing protein n=1 Tax=Aspergillus versicolor CBS 583.65 TaxID=1036611 RepID=A0A1L9Q3J4_ASPVE|nr:uncharacterized protein ASPVEDRAFT_143719 [Aspergillus versicolor CBS 583.65]OJJ08292.1 hypothetical protein ASPVEDRAFT_143719 [Aspergillus versicolor CBS 583.65]